MLSLSKAVGNHPMAAPLPLSPERSESNCGTNCVPYAFRLSGRHFGTVIPSVTGNPIIHAAKAGCSFKPSFLHHPNQRIVLRPGS